MRTEGPMIVTVEGPWEAMAEWVPQKPMWLTEITTDAPVLLQVSIGGVRIGGVRIGLFASLPLALSPGQLPLALSPGQRIMIRARGNGPTTLTPVFKERAAK